MVHVWSGDNFWVMVLLFQHPGVLVGVVKSGLRDWQKVPVPAEPSH